MSEIYTTYMTGERTFTECVVCQKQFDENNKGYCNRSVAFWVGNEKFCKDCSTLDFDIVNLCEKDCEKRDYIGRSWYKCLGYDSPCSCAYKAQYLEVRENLRRERRARIAREEHNETDAEDDDDETDDEN